MNKTFKIEVLDHIMDVEFSPTDDNWGMHPVGEGESPVMGTMSHANGHIKVNTAYNESTWLSTFCHELGHLFTNRFSYPLKEHVVDMIGMGMHSLLTHNLDKINELYHPDLKYIAEERDLLKDTVSSLMDEVEDLKDQLQELGADVEVSEAQELREFFSDDTDIIETTCGNYTVTGYKE